MFIKIGPDKHINVSDIHNLWESPGKKSFSINNKIISGYTIEDFKILYTHCKKNDTYFLDLTMPRECQMEDCPKCNGLGNIFDYQISSFYRGCRECDSSGKIRLLL